jgi:hypothetical protein
MKTKIQRCLLLIPMLTSAANAFGAGTEITNVQAVSEENEVHIEIELTDQVTPTVKVVSNPCRFIIEFPNVSFEERPRTLPVNMNGVNEVRVSENNGNPPGTRLVVGIDSVRPFGTETSGNKFVLRILPHPTTAGAEVTPRNTDGTNGVSQFEPASEAIAVYSRSSPPQVEHLPLESVIDEPQTGPAVTVRRIFNVKYIAGRTVYIDGGTNSGLRVGMSLDIHGSHSPTSKDRSGDDNASFASARVIGVATTSSITEVGSADREIQVGDSAELTSKDSEAAAENARSAASTGLRVISLPSAEGDDPSGSSKGAASHGLLSAENGDSEVQPRMAGRIGIDYSGISSSGSTPGISSQVGMSFQSDMTHILGSHWNLQGYWRGRINRHSQFQEPTIEDSLNKTYTMQLYYDNPGSKWVAGVGRLYLPWAVSLDTIDGGYFGRKSALGMTSGVFAGSTPDLNSWHWRPNQRIAGSFVNFERGGYEGFHFSSTTGVAMSTIDWKLDRPFAFLENEFCYKGTFSMYHSLIADSPLGASTNGIRPGAGVGNSYFTAHYQPKRMLSFDLYHNYFRDVPTAATAIVGTGLVDKLLFQGISAGVHLKPTRYVTLYTTLGASEKTGDSRRSLNQMYGATWSEIAHSGFRADFHYSKFDSNFAKGNYQVLSLSRQLTNQMFWNVQLGKQDMLSRLTTNYNSIFVANSMDVNIGRHSYLQSGYTYVNGATLNYRQWYLSWGYRFDKGKSNPAFVQTLLPNR